MRHPHYKWAVPQIQTLGMRNVSNGHQQEEMQLNPVPCPTQSLMLHLRVEER